MELKNYLKTIKKNWLFLLSMLLLGSLSAYFSTPHISSGYVANKDFFLSNQIAEQNQQFNFSGYFQQSTAIDATDTAVAVLQSPDFQSLLPQNASISAKKIAPQVIRITASSSKNKDAQIELEAAAKIFNEKMKELNSNSSALTINPVSPSFNVNYHSLNSKVLALAGAVIGLLFAFLILGIKEYLDL